MKKILNFITIISAIIFFPVLAFAQTSGVTFTNTVQQACTGNGLGKVICQTQVLLNSIVPVLIALGVVYFVWGIVQYVIYDEEEAKTKGREKIIYGIIGLTVIIGMWGLVNIVVNTFGLSAAAPQGLNINGTGGASCGLGSSPKFQDLLGYATCIIDSSIIPLIFTLAVVMFIWGVVNYFVINAEEEAKREQGKQFMLWGIVALAVMISVWGLVSILSSTFGINGSIIPHVTPPTQTSAG